MHNLTPIKTPQNQSVRRVKDLNIKLLNLFDAYDEQQDLIQSISKPSFKGTKIIHVNSTTSKTKFSNQFSSSPNTSKIRPFTSTIDKTSTPITTNFTISSLTNRFNEYRHKNKALNTEGDPLDDPYKLEGPTPFPISSMKKPKLAIETSQSPPKKSATLSLAQVFPKTAQNTAMKVDFLMQAKHEKKLTLDSQRKYDSSERIALMKTGPSIDKATSTYRSRPMSSYVETQGPWKLHGVRKVDMNHKLVRGQSAKTFQSKLGGPNTSRRHANLSIDLKNESSEHLKGSPSKGNMSINKTEFRIKKIIGESTLNPPKVTGNQKKRLTDFLQDEFVEEVITNKHNARNFYDGEALTNLNELKKMINSHPQIRATMYGSTGNSSRRESKVNIKEQDLPTDAPKLKHFELSDPESVMLGIRPKNFISLNNGPVIEQEKNIKPKEINETEEAPTSLTQLGKKTMNNFQALKDAIDVRKARGKRIRQALRDVLTKYSRLGISLQDVNLNIFVILDLTSILAKRN